MPLSESLRDRRSTPEALQRDAPAGGEATPVEPRDVIELEKRMATTLPDGWKLGQK